MHLLGKYFKVTLLYSLKNLFGQISKYAGQKYSCILYDGTKIDVFSSTLWFITLCAALEKYHVSEEPEVQMNIACTVIFCLFKSNRAIVCCSVTKKNHMVTKF